MFTDYSQSLTYIFGYREKGDSIRARARVELSLKIRGDCQHFTLNVGMTSFKWCNSLKKGGQLEDYALILLIVMLTVFFVRLIT